MDDEQTAGEGRMGAHPRHGPQVLDLDTPNAARLYDYYLGSARSAGPDRAVAKRFHDLAPHWPIGARLNRRFLRAAVRQMAEAGIDQFLDLGSGIPTAGNVHEIAHSVNPAAKVVYVDYEPIAYHTAADLLADEPNVTALQADLREPDTVLEAEETRGLLDFSRPVGLLMVGVLLFFDDDDRPGELVATYRQRLASGSYVAISAGSNDCPDPGIRAELDRVLEEYHRVNEHLTLRSRDEIAAWFTGTELVEPGLPGLVPYPDWPADDHDQLTTAQRACQYGYVGLGRIP